MAYLVLLAQGLQFTVYAFADERRRCRVGEFFAAPTLTDRDLAKLQAIYRRVAWHGMLMDPRKCKTLEGPILEFKASGGARLLWFYDEGRVIIATHGFIKKSQKTPRIEIELAKAIRTQYLEAKHHGHLSTCSGFEALEQGSSSPKPGEPKPGL